MRLFCFIVPILFCITATAQNTYQEYLNELQSGLPKDAAELIQRIIECNHWAGEDGYDAQRKAHIDAMWDSLKCSLVEEDKKTILSKNPTIKCKLENAFLKASNFVT